MRHSEAVRRTLCLTELCVVERDPATYNVVTVKPFCDVSGEYVSRCGPLDVMLMLLFLRSGEPVFSADDLLCIVCCPSFRG